MVREPDVHRQTICSVFGKLEIVGMEDEATIDEAGNLKEKANGWAVQYEKDLMKLNNISVGEELLRKIAKDGKITSGGFRILRNRLEGVRPGEVIERGSSRVASPSCSRCRTSRFVGG